MIHVQRSVVLDAPPDQVFAHVTDVERMPEWHTNAGFRRVVRTDGGPMGPGRRFQVERQAQGRTALIDATVTSWEPGGRFAFDTIDRSNFTGTFDFRLEPAPSGTRLTWTATMQPPGLWRLLSPVIRRAIEKAADPDLANLRRQTSAGS